MGLPTPDLVYEASQGALSLQFRLRCGAMLGTLVIPEYTRVDSLSTTTQLSIGTKCMLEPANNTDTPKAVWVEPQTDAH